MERGTPKGLKAEINVTPLVDVVLVLLIIFMVVTPMMQESRAVELPRAAHVEREGKRPHRLTVVIDVAGQVFLDGAPVPAALLPETVRLRLRDDPGLEVALKGDRRLEYQTVRDVLSSCRQAGSKRVVLATQELREERGARPGRGRPLMAAPLGGGGVRSDINVTPLIDVVLVLLIIFMVLTPTLEARFAVALPRTDLEVEAPPAEAQPLLVSLAADGRVTLNSEALDAAGLARAVSARLAGRRDKVVFFEAEPAANYGRAVEVMDLCRAAGAEHIGMIEATGGSEGLPTAPAPKLDPR